jgi:CobQ-like glutamine amidotransferase family enzyme
VIKVFSFQPDYFNQNGDQGNLDALSHFSKQDMVHVEISQADFVLIGDASRAAIRHFERDLDSLTAVLASRHQSGFPTLLVGSSYEFFLSRLALAESVTFGDRVSEFREVVADGIRVKGYRNSELEGFDLVVSGAFVGTTLFGPVLAKNPELLKRFSEYLDVEIQITPEQLEWISKA